MGWYCSLWVLWVMVGLFVRGLGEGCMMTGECWYGELSLFGMSGLMVDAAAV